MQNVNTSNKQADQPKSKKSKFVKTLISIVAFIAFMFFISFIYSIIFGSTSLNKKIVESRDARRVSEIKAIQQALELHLDREGFYPDSLKFGEALDYNGTTYMTAIPTNPTPNDGYCPDDFEYKYEVKNSGQSYELTYCLGAGSKENRGHYSVTPTKNKSRTSDATEIDKFNFEDIDSNQYSEEKLAECYIDLGIISLPVELTALSDSEKQKGWGDCIVLQKKKVENELDVDNDGLGYHEEVNIYRTNPNNPDTDGDGLTDGEEVSLGTNPRIPDTDGDGYLDGDEANNGYNPLEEGTL